MKILIVEDDPIMRETLGTCLSEEGFSVITAADGEQGLQLFHEHQPALICLDIMMPKLNGYQACKQIRRENKEVPILFLSAKNEERDVVAGFNLGADDFIRKPFTRGEVVARIHAALRRSGISQGKGKKLVMKDLVIYPQALLAERDGEKIELTKRETKILETLYEHAEQAVHRDVLLNQCWGMEYFPDSRTLDQHIVSLRKKIELNPAEPMIIETVRGVGYRFCG